MVTYDHLLCQSASLQAFPCQGQQGWDFTHTIIFTKTFCRRQWFGSSHFPSSKLVPLSATANTSIKRVFTSQSGTCPLPWQHREPQLPADPSPFSFQPLVPRCTSEQPRSDGQGEGIGTAADKQHLNPWKRCWKCYRPTIPSCCTNITGSCSVLERELKPCFPRPGLRQDSAEPCCCNARENAEEPPVQSCAASLLKLISQPFVPLAWFHSQEKQETVWNKQSSYGWSTSDDF